MASTLCVNPGGTSGCYSTIGAAVLRAQMDYIDNGTIDKIDVAAGVYMEAVKIERPVYLVGAGHGRSIINALGLANGIYIDGIDSPKPRLSKVLVAGFTIENADFEGVIPEGNYGAGPSIVWDAGRFQLLKPEPASEQIRRGKLEFELFGFKLRGRWTLARSWWP